jgi:hypothetical protein
MSLRSAAFVSMAMTLAVSSSAANAQEETRVDRFFSEKVAEEEPVFQGRVTSSTFFFQEIGESIANMGGIEIIDNASPVTRLYTELRAQLGLTQPGLNRLDVRGDIRVRMALPCEFAFASDPSANLEPGDIGYDDCRTQSGTFGGNEYELRELYGRRSGGELELQGGRQFIAEIGATKVDGVKAQYTLDDNWSLIGFGGLAPSRISRSVIDDYDGGVLPIAVGAGGAYRFQRYFGSIGAAGIVPLSTQNADADIQPRTFVTSTGYWRPSAMLDVYHFASVDLTGPSTEDVADMFTNVSLGLNVKPVDDLRITAAVHHFSTDTLEEFALQRLDTRGEQNIIQNNVDVLRQTAQSARLGVSLAMMEKRFEVSTTFALRHRPSETVCPANDPDCAPAMGQTSRDAWSGEAMLSLVDRQSIGGLRLGASVINMFGLYDSLGLGDESYGRSNYLVARIDASRALMNEQAQIDVDVSYLHAEDAGSASCAAEGGVISPLTCYGDTVTDTISLGGTVYYRFQPDWFALVTANAALQSFTPGAAVDAAMQTSYSNTLITGFLRLAYRF